MFTRVHGLYVPTRAAPRYEMQTTKDGLPDLDVGKVLAAVARCKERHTALDIGAHYGATTLAMARQFQRVIAFEPIPETFATLKMNAEQVTNIECWDCAIAKGHETLSFEVLWWHSQLSHNLKAGEQPYFEGSSIIGPIDARPLDSFGFENVSFIKIDVEGSEIDVVEGSRETLSRCRPVVMIEQGGAESKFHGTPRDEAARFLESLGMVRIGPSPTTTTVCTAFPGRSSHRCQFVGGAAP